ncbi:PAS domain-containing protein [Rubrivivax sp. RP6-9]|uniref:PAS domain-containing protein n=1 Tax=Rubrivivax sp. RP6-9 TaxID=3415750 RepID=UPI003CC5CA93
MPFEPSAASPLAERPQQQRTLLLPLLLVAGLIVALAAIVSVREFSAQQRAAEAELLAVADLRRLQVQTWLQEHLRLARFLANSTVFAGQYLDGQVRGNRQALQLLMGRLIELRQANGNDEVLLLDAQARVVARESPLQQDIAPTLRDAALRAMQTGEVVHTGIYRREGHTPTLRLDIVLPLVATGRPAQAAVVLRQDPQRQLYPLLRAWPVPKETGESVLWERRPEGMLAISDFRFGDDTAGRLLRRLDLADPPVAVLLRDADTDTPPLLGPDYRGVQVLAAGRPIEGTDWLVVTKIDQREIDAPARTTAAWASVMALLALLVLGAGARLFVQRAALRGSEREHAADRRRLETLALLQAITDSSGDAIFAKDAAGRFLLCNAACAAGMGHAPEDVLGKRVDELLPQGPSAALADNDRQVLKGSGNQVFEEQLETAHGPRVFLTTKGPLRDAEGHVIGLFGVARDVTAARQAELDLRDSEARLRSVFDVLAEGIMVFDRQGRMLSANPGAAQLLGLPLDALVGDWFDVSGWHPLADDGSPKPPETLPPALALATGLPQRDVDVLVGGPQGQRRWFRLNAEPIPGGVHAGAPAVALSFVDITEQRLLADELERHRHHLQALVDGRTRALQQANAQLAETERFLRLLADNLPVRIAYWDRDLVLRFANRAYFEWWRTTAEAAIGSAARAIHGEDHWQRHGHEMQAAAAGEARVHERETVREDGSTWHHQVHYLPDRDADGGVRGVYALALDITPTKTAQARLHQLNIELEHALGRAEGASRAKSAFLANMSHEIRTPMNAIIGLAHLMRRDVVDGQQRDRLDKISRSAHHLLEIINDILDLSKIEAGRMTLEDIGFSLDALLARSFEMVAEEAQRKQVELIVDTDHLPDALRGDPTRLSQALLNLLSNAVKFTERGWVRLVCEKLAEDGDRVQARFTVSDTGAGIPPERMASLFSAFEQVDSSTSRRHGGTGLGLALTRHLATLMGGEAGARSTPGAGSSFWFTAWLGRGSAAAADGPGLAGRRVLLVDDLAEARAALAERLRQFDMQVDAVESGERALALAQAAINAGTGYDLLLIDWRMEPLDGLQTLHHLRALLGDGLPPAVLVTAHDEDQVRHDAARARFAAVLAKPITASTLHDTLLRVLRQDRSAPETAASGPGAQELALRRAAAGARVLLAEDNPVNQEVALELLRVAGLQVDVASDGHEAVAMVLRGDYDAVLMDVQMPALDGLAATRALRQRGHAGPVIAMTANAFGEDRAACLAAGMDDHVPKPVDPEQLYATLQRWLPQRGGTDSRAADRGADQPTAPAPTPDALLLQRCAAVPGLDTGAALRAAGGDVALLRRLLQRFAQHYAAGVPALAQPAADKALPGWELAAHSLQGACSAIGATALQTQARALEAAARAATGNPGAAAAAAALQPQAAALHTALQGFVAALQRTLQ